MPMGAALPPPQPPQPPPLPHDSQVQFGVPMLPGLLLQLAPVMRLKLVHALPPRVSPAAHGPRAPASRLPAVDHVLESAQLLRGI
jgi:hypothetical protein